MTEADQNKLLEGYRRAHAWLRFSEAGDGESVAELRREFEGPDAYRFVAHGLASRSRWFLQKLAGAAPGGLRSAHDHLDQQLYATPPGAQEWQRVVDEWLNITLSLGRRWDRRQKRRVALYEKAALDGLEAEGPESNMRKRMFAHWPRD